MRTVGAVCRLYHLFYGFAALCVAADGMQVAAKRQKDNSSVSTALFVGSVQYLERGGGFFARRIDHHYAARSSPPYQPPGSGVAPAFMTF